MYVKRIHVSGLHHDDDHLSARLSSRGAADPGYASPTRPMASETSRDLAPLVKRADEIQAHHPLMAYYCACPSSRATKRLFASCEQPDDARRVSSLRRAFEPARATHR